MWARYCQSKGVIHRDIKPANLLVFYDSDERPDTVGELLSHEHARIMIVDFGLAKSPSRGDPQATAEGEVMGPPAFVAPEQAEGKEADHRSEISPEGTKAPEEWCEVRLRTSSDQVVLYLDGHLASYAQFESPVAHLALAFELTQGRLMQVNDIRVIAPE